MKEGDLVKRGADVFWFSLALLLLAVPTYWYSGAREDLHTLAAGIGALLSVGAILLSFAGSLTAIFIGFRSLTKFRRMTWHPVAAVGLSWIIFEIARATGWLDSFLAVIVW